MALTDVETVRLRTSDQPTFHRQDELGDGSTTAFKLYVTIVSALPVLRVWKDGVPQTVVTDYTIDSTNGWINFVAAPISGAELRFEYSGLVYSDAEIEQFLTDAGDSTVLASGFLLLSWAAAMAKVARKETLNGGGPLGSVTTDTAVRARELRESAKAYIEMYRSADAAGGGAYDSITEVPWTHWIAEALVLDELLAGL